MAIDTARVQRAVRELLAAIGEDPDRSGLVETPERVSESYEEFFAGIGVDPLVHLKNTIPLGEDPGEVVLVKDISLRSTCEHHLLPFLGRAHIAYAPGDRVVGLGSLPKVVATLAARPQVQERLTEQIAQAIETGLDAAGVLVVIEASHGCVTMRGPRQEASTTVTIASRGVLAEPARRAEIITLIGAVPHPSATDG